MVGYPAGGAAPPRGCGARSFLDRGASAGGGDTRSGKALVSQCAP
jgi:hypothetical protein